eukprot:6246937-Prymnesium_polylepis.1
MKTAVTVLARIKPPPLGQYSAVHASEQGVVVQGKTSNATLDGFGSIVVGSDQAQAYEHIAAPLVDRLLEGYSCSLMAYGQTGSGKTHTIFGPPGVLTEAALSEVDGDGYLCDGSTGAVSAP